MYREGRREGRKEGGRDEVDEGRDVPYIVKNRQTDKQTVTAASVVFKIGRNHSTD